MTGKICCVQLRTAAFVIAIIEIANFSIDLAHSAENIYVAGYNKYHAADFHFAGTLFAELHEKQYTDLLIISIGETLTCIVRILAAVILIFGIHKEKLNWVKSWLWIKLMTLTFSISMFLFSIFSGDPQSSIVWFWIGSILVEVSFLWVINKYYAEMKLYANRIPKTRITSNSVAIPMGSCRMPYNEF